MVCTRCQLQERGEHQNVYRPLRKHDKDYIYAHFHKHLNKPCGLFWTELATAPLAHVPMPPQQYIKHIPLAFASRRGCRNSAAIVRFPSQISASFPNAILWGAINLSTYRNECGIWLYQTNWKILGIGLEWYLPFGKALPLSALLSVWQRRLPHLFRRDVKRGGGERFCDYRQIAELKSLPPAASRLLLA